MDEFIVSPAPEYHLNADWKKVIKKPMIILLPVVLPPTFITENLRVYVFQSIAGQVVKYPIGEKSKQNVNDEFSFFEISEDRKNILIYTYHFSGVVACYKCNTDVRVRYLKARIKGSNQPQKHGREVRIRYEFFQETNGIKDFESQPKNVHNGLVLIEENKTIKVPAKIDNDSKMIIKLNVTGDERHLWECKKQPSGEEIFPFNRVVFIKELVTCSAHMDTFYIDFVICGKPRSTTGSLQPFECVIDVYEKDADGTERAVAIPSPNISYLTLSNQFGTEQTATCCHSRDKETDIYPERVVEYTRAAQESHANYGTQPIAQRNINSFELRGDNRSMTEFIDRECVKLGEQEIGLLPGKSRQASLQKDEATDGPQAMTESDLIQIDHQLPCVNSDINEYSAPPDPDQDQTVPITQTYLCHKF